MVVPYNYEMVSNSTKMSNNGLILSDVVLDVEYAITDMLLKNLFTECVAYYQKMGLNKRLRNLMAGQVIGISSQSNDMVTDCKLSVLASHRSLCVYLLFLTVYLYSLLHGSSYMQRYRYSTYK
jgi:hypothetical protein